MSPATLPRPANPILPLPAPVVTQTVTSHLRAGANDVPESDNVVVVYTAPEHEKLMENIAELYRWVAEAMVQLEYYRNRKGS